jgi:hypothetical protein
VAAGQIGQQGDQDGEASSSLLGRPSSVAADPSVGVVFFVDNDKVSCVLRMTS